MPLVRLGDERLAVHVQQRAVQPLEADRRARPPAHALAARSLEVAGKHRDPVGQAQQLRQALELRRRVAAAEVGPTDVADEQ